MKKIFFSLLMAFAIFFVNVDNTEAQCPAGYNIYTIPSINVGGCNYRVTLCYKCSVQGISENFIKVIAISLLDTNCNPTWTDSTLLVAIDNAITLPPSPYLGLFCTNPPCCEIPEDQPCDPVLRTIYKVVTPICWKKRQYAPGKFEWEACDSYAGCVQAYGSCVRNGVINTIKVGGRYLENAQWINCTDYDDGDFYNAHPTYWENNIGNWTPCYEVRNLCD